MINNASSYGLSHGSSAFCCKEKALEAQANLLYFPSSRPQTCEYGDNCPRAHCEKELQEWKMRAAEKKQIRQNIEAQGLMTYNEMILEEYRNSTAEENIVSVKYLCDYSLVLSASLVITHSNANLLQTCKTCYECNCHVVFNFSSLIMSMMSESLLMQT